MIFAVRVLKPRTLTFRAINRSSNEEAGGEYERHNRSILGRPVSAGKRAVGARYGHFILFLLSRQKRLL
jgi:hypothetical protein